MARKTKQALLDQLWLKRMRQELTWLKANFYCHHKIETRWLSMSGPVLQGDHGCTDWKDDETEGEERTIVIIVARDLPLYTALDVLHHEYCHALTMHLDNEEAHTDEFWTTYGKIYRRYYDEDGSAAVGTL